jgi:hypothetical protein
MLLRAPCIMPSLRNAGPVYCDWRISALLRWMSRRLVNQLYSAPGRGQPGSHLSMSEDCSLHRRLHIVGSTIAVAGTGTEPYRAQPSAGGVGNLAEDY